MTDYEKQQKFMQDYGDVEVRFSEYDKYTFTFQGEHGGNIITVDVGGNADDIYRVGVAANIAYTINQLQPYAGRVYSPNSVELLSFYNY